MPAVLNFVTSSQFIVSFGILLISLLLLKRSITKQVMKITEIMPGKPIGTNGSTSLVTSAVTPVGKVEVSAPNAVQQITMISSDKSELSLTRFGSDFASVEIDKYVQIPTLGSIRDGLTTKSALSSTLGGLTQVGAVALSNPNGLFTATVNPTLLTKFGDGTFSTMIHGSEGIAQNAGYQAASASVFAPLIIFQAMSMVTGQYYLQGITKQLESIDKKIERLVQLHHIERLAKIRYCVSLIKKLHMVEHPNIEDMVSLKMMENEIGIIHEEYVHQLSSLDLAELKNSDKWKTSSKLEELYSKVNDASFDFSLNMAITTDELLHLITIVEMILNSRMSDNVENRAKRLGELLNLVKSWDAKEFYRARFGDTSVAEFYSKAVDKAQEIYDKAIMGKDKVLSAISEFKGKQAQIEENIGGKIHALEMGRKLIKQMAEPVEILYLSDSNLGDRVLIKRNETI
ncbi:MAG: hypothetical protein HKM05_12415 [Spirochaetales bacterium]|nr:hypothetical protein [Spirochaetales bacterium]